MPLSVPATLPGLSAKQFLLGLAGGAALLFIFAALTTSVLSKIPLMHAIVPVVFLGGGGLLVLLGFQVQRRLISEIRGGYSTLRINFGRVRGDRWRQDSTRGGWLTWDYRGIWFLGSDGTVRAEPLPGLLAPGFYPSPDSPDSLELWTGVSWSGYTSR